MKLYEFIKLLNKNNIYFYDSIYRITFDRLINLIDIKNTFQTGGGNIYYTSPLKIIKSFNKDKLEEIMDYLLNNQYNYALQMCKIKYY